MNIGIFQDILTEKGGAQRFTIGLANYLNFDIVTSGFNPELRRWMNIDTKIIDLGNVSMKYAPIIGYNIEAPLRFFLNRNRFNYDTFIYSGLSSIFGSKKENNNIWFCHSPNRILYDLREAKLKEASPIKKIFYKIYIRFLYEKDQKVVKENFREIIVNSKNVQKRVKKYYNKNSIIIYPPINTKKFKFNKFGDFYLVVSRLIPEKRVDLIAKSFSSMTDKKLIIVGDGPEKEKILKITKDKCNIKLFDNLNDKELLNLYADCLATIYMPLEEDFGLVPLEGMASGKSCIAANEGGCKETVIHNKTGFLITVSEKELIKTVKNFNIEKAEKMKNECINQAKKFDINNCIKQWRQLLKEHNKKLKR